MIKLMVVLAAGLLATTCARGLSHDEALKTISTHESLRPTDNVVVNAISSSSPNEAIVRTTIAGETLNLKLRKFDTGWVWEFAETRAGGWIAAAEAVGQIRETRRVEAAAKWATEHKVAYASTAKLIDRHLTITPTPRVGLDAVQWVRTRNQFADIAERYKEGPDWQERVAFLRDMRPADTWGNEFLIGFDSEQRTITLVSIGPDKTKNTEDDLIGVKTFRPVMEDGEMRWSASNSWKLPEGLGEVVKEFTEEPWSTVAHSKVVKP